MANFDNQFILKRIVNKISIDGDDTIIWFKSLCVGRSLKAINKLWFMTEKEAINACNKYKKIYR